MMKMNPVFACPYCRKELIDLKCSSCGFEGKFEDGLYHLHRSDTSWDLCMDQVSKIKAAEIIEAKINRHVVNVLTNPELEAVYKANNEAQAKNFDDALKFLSPIQGKKILDMGCADGHITNTLVGLGAEMSVGIDFYLRGNLKSKDNLILILGDFNYVPFLDENFDIILDAGTLHHAIDKFFYIGEIYRLLKPGGIFYSYGSCPSPTLEKLNAMKGHQKWWMDTYGLYEIAWGIGECRDVFSKIFSKPVNIIYLTWSTPNGTLCGEDAVVWCRK